MDDQEAFRLSCELAQRSHDEALAEPSSPYAGKFVGIVAIVVVLVPGRAAFFLLEDDVIEPLAERHAGAARGLARTLPGLGADAFHAPRDAEFHS